ncbi:MAG: PASTA domain-containing protein [Desulfonatronovibrio sp. MSAO_Bac4]|nr:MAG: PASTA domain-containing protein [Desulfonatronovibrio sp. MSAO_Bac4]
MSKRVTDTTKKDRSRLKIILILSLFIIAWAGLWSRAFFVQVLQGEELARMADRQYFSREKITGKRGEIFDRNGVVLAQSVRVKSIYADPLRVEDSARAAFELAKVLDVDSGRLRQLLDRQSRFVWVQRKISDRRAQSIAEKNIPGIYIIDEHTRVYPRGHMLGQIMGFVGVDNEGLEGLEKSLEETLAGAEMLVALQRDASGHRMTLMPQDVSSEVAGRDVVLTIDAELQFAAEKALSRAVENYNARHGVSLVVHVPTGDILAWANYPFFNPNNFRGSHSSIWRNRGAVDALEPGSTLKPFLIAAALEEGIVDHDTIYFCENGRWRLGRNNIRDVRDHGWLTINRIIRYSSNICSAKIGLDLGPGKYFEYLDRLGFAETTGLPLPGETRGILRPPNVWSRMDLATISFGQGLSGTPLQLARAYLTLANDGRFTDLNILMNESRVQNEGHQVFSPRVSRQVMEMLREVVEMDGTGTRAAISGIEVGGKTGTAQKASESGGYGDKYVASFVGFIPALDPEYLVLIIVDEPAPQHYGGVVAAPVFAQIGNSIMASGSGFRLRSYHAQNVPNLTEISVSDNGRFSVTQRRNTSMLGNEMPDLRGVSLREAMESLLRAGVVPVLKGKGVLVKDHAPGPGENWQGDNVQVVLRLSES